MDETEKIIVLIIFGILFLVVLFVEFRYIRKRGGFKKKYATASRLKKDNAFNALHTTKAVRNKLIADGYDIAKAEYIIGKANDAMSRGDYDACIDLCGNAREELIRSRRDGGLVRDERSPSSEMEPAEPEPELPESEEAIKSAVSTSGGLYLQSKFELNAARDELASIEGSPEKSQKASKLIEESEQLFERGEYQRSLSISFKARKLIAGEIDETEEKRAEKKEMIVEERPGGTCSNCGASLGEDDSYCGACGLSVRAKNCSSCGAELREGDTFCRKCGAKN